MDIKRIIEVFDRISPIVSDMVGGPVHLVQIRGTRWSYVAGHVPEELPFVESQRVMLDEEWGILYYPEPGRKIDPEQIRCLFLEGIEIDNDT